MKVALSILLISSVASAETREQAIRRNVTRIPGIHLGDAREVIDAAISLETTTIQAELLTALAWLQTDFDPGPEKTTCGMLGIDPTNLNETRLSCIEWSQDTKAGMAAGIRLLQMKGSASTAFPAWAWLAPLVVDFLLRDKT